MLIGNGQIQPGDRPAFGAPPGAAALAVDLDRGAGAANPGKPRHGRGAPTVGLLRAPAPGAHGRGDDAGRGAGDGAGRGRRQPPPGAGAARQRGTGHGAPGLGPAGAGTAAGAAPEPPLRQHRPAASRSCWRAAATAGFPRRRCCAPSRGARWNGAARWRTRELVATNSCTRGDDALPARGDQTRRHGGGGIADLLRDAAVAGSHGPARAGDSHPPGDGRLGGGAGTGDEEARRRGRCQCLPADPPTAPTRWAA
jgi:hypothetical protein